MTETCIQFLANLVIIEEGSPEDLHVLVRDDGVRAAAVLLCLQGTETRLNLQGREVH